MKQGLEVRDIAKADELLYELWGSEVIAEGLANSGVVAVVVAVDLRNGSVRALDCNRASSGHGHSPWESNSIVALVLIHSTTLA
jgi:hypothetical protein